MFSLFCLFRVLQPVRRQKAQRLLPTNLYVVLFNFKGREADELDLKYVVFILSIYIIKDCDAENETNRIMDSLTFVAAKNVLRAGYKVTVIDASDPDWWRGKCLGQIGFFPSKYVAKLAPNEKPLQVTHNLQLGGNDDGTDSDPNRLTKLLRDQVYTI